MLNGTKPLIGVLYYRTQQCFISNFVENLVDSVNPFPVVLFQPYVEIKYLRNLLGGMNTLINPVRLNVPHVQ